MRLIDADKLISSLNWLVESGMTGNKTKAVIKLAIQTADGQPTVDAEPVVRCKDCIHKPRGTRNKHDMEFPDEICPCQCDDYWYSWMPYDDWFCANGERREDETN